MYSKAFISDDHHFVEKMIEKEMHNYRVQAVQAMSSLIVHSKCDLCEIEAFTKILAYGYFDSLPEAEMLTDKLYLSKLHYLAVLENEQAFRDVYAKEAELFYDYEF